MGCIPRRLRRNLIREKSRLVNNWLNTPSLAAGWLYWLFVTRILAALGGALFTPTSSAVAISLAPPAKRGRALALVFAGLPISTVVGVPLGTFVGSNFNWRFTFTIVVVLGVIALVAVFITIKALSPSAPLNLKIWFGLLRQPRILLALSVTFWQYTAQFLAFTYIAQLLKLNTGLDGTGISLMLFVFGAAAVIGNSVGGRVADRWNLNRTLVLSLGGVAVSLFLLSVVSGSVVGVAIDFIIWGLFGFSFNPVQQSRLVGLVPQAPNLVLSLNSSMLYLGNAAGAALGGIVVSSLPITAICWIGGLITIVAIGFVFLSARQATGVPLTRTTVRSVEGK